VRFAAVTITDGGAALFPVERLDADTGLYVLVRAEIVDRERFV
jgi:hypothetical protein